MFHVKQPGVLCRRLLPDTEVPEDHVEHVLDINPAGETAESGGCQAKLLSDDFFPSGVLARGRPLQRIQGVLKGSPVTGPGNENRFASASELRGCFIGYGGDQSLDPLASDSGKPKGLRRRCGFRFSPSRYWRTGIHS